MRCVDVWLSGQKAGTLHELDNVLSFSYNSAYVTSGIIPISLNMPLTNNKYTGQMVMDFFKNLVPEGSIHIGMCHISHLDTSDVIGFLLKWGRECAGALSFVPPGEVPEETGEKLPLHIKSYFKNDYIPLSISGECMTYRQAPPKVRMSLGGGQDKLPVIIENNKLFVPVGGQPSTHILKPNLPQFPHSARNEALCLNLAKRIGLDVVDCTVIPVARGAFVAIKRYDRMNGKRLHQIDFCQILGLSSKNKYQKNDAHDNYEGIASLLHLCRQYNINAPDGSDPADFFWKAMLYSWYVKNTDAHAKNYSAVFYPNNDGYEIRLAPLYDINSMYYYRHADNVMAMRYGDALSHSLIRIPELLETADSLGIDRDRALEDIIIMGQSICRNLPILVDEHRDSYRNAQIYHKLQKVIIKHAEKAINDTEIELSMGHHAHMCR